MNWLSISNREYASSRSNATFTGIPFPEGIEEKISDKNGNNIPDTYENITPAE